MTFLFLQILISKTLKKILSEKSIILKESLTYDQMRIKLIIG